MFLKLIIFVLFAVAWAAVIFLAVRAILIAWTADRRAALASAIAVAAAFLLGASARFAQRPAPVIVAAPAAPASAVRLVQCPAGAHPIRRQAAASFDNVKVGSEAPIGTAGTVRVPANETLLFGGWVTMPAGPGDAICAIVDGRAMPGYAAYGVARPDVAAALGVPSDATAGFLIPLQLSPGHHVVAVGVLEKDGRTVDEAPPHVELIAAASASRSVR